MEQFLSDIRAYARAHGVLPTTIVQRIGVGSGSTWARWESGKSSPTLKTVDRIRQYMAQNPAPVVGKMPDPKMKEAS
jgi:transcriptional regulator with XRE-family HTH domain